MVELHASGALFERIETIAIATVCAEGEKERSTGVE